MTQLMTHVKKRVLLDTNDARTGENNPYRKLVRVIMSWRNRRFDYDWLLWHQPAVYL